MSCRSDRKLFIAHYFMIILGINFMQIGFTFDSFVIITIYIRFVSAFQR